MMNLISFSTTRSLAGLCSSFLLAGSMAQDPTSVDVDLRQSTDDTNNLEVYVRANGAGFGDVLSGLTFTLRWVTTSPATLGTRVNACPGGIAISATAQVTDPVVDSTPTGFNYRTYNAFGTSLLSDDGCALPADDWYLVMTVPVVNNTGCTEFQIVNDAFTTSPGNARDFFVSLGGFDRTGVIEPTSVHMGVCTPDCLGIPGGTALPGAPCDDGNPDSMDDTYTPECLCVGVPLGVDASMNHDAAFSLSPNPTSGRVLISLSAHMRGPLTCAVFDALGRSVNVTTGASPANADQITLDLSAVPAGVYLIEIACGGRRSVERIVKR